MTDPSHARPGAVRVRAPATSANLGPGFDCLGAALDLWNEVFAAPADGSPSAEWTGEPLQPGAQDLVLSAARKTFASCAVQMPDLRLVHRIGIPVGRGLGSSAAAIVCGVLLANRLMDDALSQDEVLDLATKLEGHPDNVVACLLGGVRVATLASDGGVVQVGVPLGLPLVAALFVPDQALSTEHARRALPSSVPFEDAVFNVGRVALLVAALATGQRALLFEATHDRLHQPHREPLFRAGMKLIRAAHRAGALGASMSGAGPSVLALCADEVQAGRVAAALEAEAQSECVPGRSTVTRISAQGAHVVDD